LPTGGTKNPYISEIFFAHVPKARAFIAPLPIDKGKMMIKKLRHWEWIANFFIAPLPIFVLCDVKQKLQLEQCAPLTIQFPIANYCTRWR
jgi:hypothetical protein